MSNISITILPVKRKHFLAYAFANSQLIINIIGIMGHAVASPNTRILDTLGKKVIEESSLRVLTDLRNNGIIGKSRGRIHILRSEALSDAETEDLWI